MKAELESAEFEKQVDSLQQKLSGSPYSGQRPGSISEGVELTYAEARSALLEKELLLREMETKQKELEKIIEDKDEEIIELMGEVNSFQEGKIITTPKAVQATQKFSPVPETRQVI